MIGPSVRPFSRNDLHNSPSLCVDPAKTTNLLEECVDWEVCSDYSRPGTCGGEEHGLEVERDLNLELIV